MLGGGGSSFKHQYCCHVTWPGCDVSFFNASPNHPTIYDCLADNAGLRLTILVWYRVVIKNTNSSLIKIDRKFRVPWVIIETRKSMKVHPVVEWKHESINLKVSHVVIRGIEGCVRGPCWHREIRKDVSQRRQSRPSTFEVKEGDYLGPESAHKSMATL